MWYTTAESFARSIQILSNAINIVNFLNGILVVIEKEVIEKKEKKNLKKEEEVKKGLSFR